MAVDAASVHKKLLRVLFVFLRITGGYAQNHNCDACRTIVLIENAPCIGGT